MQPEVNIGLLGHVDHGKTTLTKAITGKWTATHSEELKRGITMRIGFADAEIRYCENCGKYSTKAKCPFCGAPTKIKRKISFVDAPGHETLMANAIAASTIMDGVLFVIAANEPCPQPQTREHMEVLNIIGVKNVVVVQTKVDTVSKEKALENYRQIQEFLKGTVAEDAPIIPVAGNFGLNVHYVLEAIEEKIPTPERDESADPLMFVCRSFDINKPGTPIEELKGGVLGGTIERGVLKVGDEIEIRPGFVEEGKYKPLTTTVESLSSGSEQLEIAKPGGLIGVGTKLDPYLTKADGMVGNVVGKNLPEVVEELSIDYTPLKRDFDTTPKKNNPMVLSIYTATTIGFPTEIKGNVVHLKLKRPVVRIKDMIIPVMLRRGNRWVLGGYGKVI